MPDWPELAMVTIWVALVWPSRVEGKVSCAGVTARMAGVSPVPERLVLAGATPAVVLEAVRKPVRPPEAVGVKLTAVEQEAPEARVVAQVLEVRAKSPLTMIARPASATLPGLVMVTDCAVLVWPRVVAGKVSDVGRTVREAGRMPVPVTATWTGATPRLVLPTRTMPDWLPEVCG